VDFKGHSHKQLKHDAKILVFHDIKHLPSVAKNIKTNFKTTVP